MAAASRLARAAAAGTPAALGRGCSAPSGSSRPTPTGSTRCSPRTRSPRSRGTPTSRPLLLDVGGGPGYFADAFRAAGAATSRSTPTSASSRARGTAGPGTVLGSGLALPVRDAVVDICLLLATSSSTSPDPWRMADEMVRVTRPGGLVVLSFTIWFVAVGRPRDVALALPRRRTGRPGATSAGTGTPPKNRVRRDPVPAIGRPDAALGARGRDAADVVALLPRYHPWWARWVVRVPGAARGRHLEPRRSCCASDDAAARGRAAAAPTRGRARAMRLRRLRARC